VVRRNLVVIGGSAGAVEAVAYLLGELPADFPGYTLVVLHLAATSNADWLRATFAKRSRLSVETPADEQALEPGRVYVARPDHHLLVKKDRVLANRGPRENLWRPAIDVLFRSAAVAYDSRVIGVLLSGELDDGTSGLQAISACGGVTVVQNPEDALHPAMLQTALANVRVDHCTTLRELPSLLVRLVEEPAPSGVSVPESLRKEVRMIEVPQDAAELMLDRGSPVAMSCPECSGPLWRGGSDRTHFRCLVGHAFHLNTLADSADDELDKTLWAAIRMFEQRVNISRMLGDQEHARGRPQRAQLYDSRARESQRHAQTLRELHQRRRLVLDESDE
jgi:two-component system, chemotaxis family, protein-glutamate methylesterase/glutaminase